MYIVPEKLISELISLKTSYSAVEDVFSAMAKKKAYNFPVIRESIGYSNALYGFKSGFDKEGLSLGLKAGGYWPENESMGIPNHQSTIFLFDANTGKISAIVGGNLLTAFRTAAASSISINHLARQDSKVLGMIGAGYQSAFQMQAAARQRGFEKILGWNHHPEMISRLEQTAEELGILYETVSLERLGAESDVIITITSSFSAILKSCQVKPGTHIACMGTDTKGKQEVGSDLVARASLFTDEMEQSITIGEAQHAFNSGLISKENIIEIGSVINGTHPGRKSEKEITMFDGTGVGLQDLAVAGRVVTEAVERGLVINVEF